MVSKALRRAKAPSATCQVQLQKSKWHHLGAHFHLRIPVLMCKDIFFLYKRSKLVFKNNRCEPNIRILYYYYHYYEDCYFGRSRVKSGLGNMFLHNILYLLYSFMIINSFYLCLHRSFNRTPWKSLSSGRRPFESPGISLDSPERYVGLHLH